MGIDEDRNGESRGNGRRGDQIEVEGPAQDIGDTGVIDPLLMSECQSQNVMVDQQPGDK